MSMIRPKLVALAALLAAVALAACTRPNPDACCTNQEECLALGSSELRPCAAGKVCSNNSCLAAQCTTAAECTAAAPYCSNQLCASTCRGDGDCVGVPGAPICAPDGVCVGCRGNPDCSGATAICDAEDRTCRGCEADSDCASGICLEADGICATEAETVYVNSAGGTDAGNCTKSSQCQSLAYAFTKTTSSRTVVRLSAGNAGISSTLNPGQNYIYIDASNDAYISYSGTTDVPAILVGSGGRLTIENASFQPSARVFIAGGSLRLNRVVANPNSSFPNFVEQTGGQLLVDRSTIQQSVHCGNGGVLSLKRTHLGTLDLSSGLESGSCDIQINRSQISAANSALYLVSGKVIVENNLLVTSTASADMVLLRNTSVGSRFQFNTIVNTSGSEFNSVAITCDAASDVAYNIISYGSNAPHSAGCPTRYNLYDRAAGFVVGEGNVVADSATFFVDPSRRDYRPSPGSPARGMAEAGAANAEDFNGGPRPLPIGSRADVGAFEVP
jgi:hypothetical protein